MSVSWETEMNAMEKTTTIRILLKTKTDLDLIGRKPESYDDIVRRLIDHYKRTTKEIRRK